MYLHTMLQIRQPKSDELQIIQLLIDAGADLDFVSEDVCIECPLAGVEATAHFFYELT